MVILHGSIMPIVAVIQLDLFFINGRTNGTNKQQMYQLNIGNPQQFMIPNQQQIPPQKLHDASNKTCKVTQHFIIHKSKEPNCQRQAGSSQLAKLPRFQHAGHVASMCLKTPGFAITAYNLLPFVGSIRSTETQCSLICCSMLNSRI
jgi:hypothetical protein